MWRKESQDWTPVLISYWPPKRSWLVVLAFALAGCGGGVQAASGQAQLPTETDAATLTATTTATPAPPTPTVTVTRTATVSTTATASATPSPTPTLHPLTIDWLRSQDYPGSDITIEETLEPGANYNRFITSYQSDGLQIFALLTVPFGEAPQTGWPVVVFNHGYIPPDQYRTTERYVAYVDTFARSGYIVFRSDYRGHGNSEGVARGGYGAPDYTIDILNAVASIKQYPDADPERIGMWGHSDGWLHHPSDDGHVSGHQSRRDLGWCGGLLPRSVRALAAPRN